MLSVHKFYCCMTVFPMLGCVCWSGMVPGHNANSQEFIMAKTARKHTAKPAPEQAAVVHQDLSITTEQVQETPKAKAARKSHDQLYAKKGTFGPTDKITLGDNTKAKAKGSMAEAKFALYGDLSNGGEVLVSDVLAKCQGDNRATFVNEDGKTVNLKPSIRWDWAHDLIRINGAQYVA